MTIFLVLVGIGLCANFYILCGVSSECQKGNRSTGRLIRISAEPQKRIDERQRALASPPRRPAAKVSTSIF